MPIADRVVTALRALLVIAFLAIAVAQVAILPPVWQQVAADQPDLAYLRWPTLVVALLALGCGQVVIACTYRLLALVQRDRIFDDPALPWVDGIVAAIGAGWVLLLGLFAYVTLTWDGPGFPVALLVLLLAGAVVGLLVVVMRALLLQATTLRRDMDGVI